MLQHKIITCQFVIPLLFPGLKERSFLPLVSDIESNISLPKPKKDEASNVNSESTPPSGKQTNYRKADD